MKNCNCSFFLLVFLMVFPTTGCIEYKTQICTDAKKVDVPQLAGDRTIILFDSEKLEDIEVKLKVIKLGKGEYSDGKQKRFRTCRFGSMMIAETQTKWETYQSSAINLLVTDGVAQGDLVVGKSKLEAAGIPYRIENRQIEDSSSWGEVFRLLHPASRGESYDVMVVDNSTVTSQARFEKIARSLGVGFIIKSS